MFPSRPPEVGTKSAHHAPDMLGSEAVGRDTFHSETLDECLRGSLTCQLACIACAEAALRHGRFKPRSSLIRACLSSLEACMALAHVVVPPQASRDELEVILLRCINACATCEAECLAASPTEPLTRRCRFACSKLRLRCGRLLSSAPNSSLVK